MKHPGSARNFESTLRLLAQRGHRLQLVFDSMKGGSAIGIVERLQQEFPSVTASRAPKVRPDGNRALARGLRLGIDYLRYLEPRYAGAPALRARAEQWAPAPLRTLIRLPLVRTRQGIALVGRVLRALERAVPTPPAVDELLRAARPDVVLVTPLVGLGSPQAEYVRSAQKLGVPAGLLVHSWDNLTNKGLIRDVPDLVTVWNEPQALEAVELHGVPRERVVVTGAAAYDHWFGWRPSRARDEFCAEIGLRADAPIVLYLCSSPFVAPEESHFVRRWIEGLRASGGMLAEAGVLVRPHPQNAGMWEGEPLRALDQVAVWPSAGADPVDTGARADYYDSLHHAAAVVGVNTTALIESAIVGRPVLTVLDEEFAGTQAGTLHFHHLVGVGGGLLSTARTIEEHATQLEHAIERGSDTSRADGFVAAFVRPHGLEQPATPLLVNAIEALRGAVPSPTRPSLVTGAAVRVLARRAAKHPQRLHGKPAEPEVTALDPVDEARRAVRRATRGTLPIFVGPFTAEIGYELLYWIPFLNWAVEQQPRLADRLIAVSRGGTESWYGGLATSYVELFEHVAPEELRRLSEAVTAETLGYRKQYTVTSLDRDLLGRVAVALGVSEYETLHPSAMFTAYRALAKQGSLHRKDAPFQFRPLQPPPLGELEGELPDDFVAVRFYFSPAFPDTPENRDQVSSVLESLGQSRSVVLLTPGIAFDDHVDSEISDASWLRRVDRLMTPTNNLRLQTAIVARARAFVGTYGGLSYLPPLLGVPSLAFYSEPSRFRPQHLEAAQRAFASPPYGRFLAVDVAQADLLRATLGRVLVGHRR